MSTKIRLARGGRKKIPYYRVVVADSHSRRDGKFIEQIGTYNPLLTSEDEKRFVIDTERAKYWLGTGSIPSDRVAILMSKAGIEEAKKHLPKFTPKKKAEKPENTEEVKEEVKE
jgi:small subunit ribosomal protein S16